MDLLSEIFEENPAQGFANFTKMEFPTGMLSCLDFVEEKMGEGFRLGLKAFNKPVIAGTYKVSANIEHLKSLRDNFGIDIESEIDKVLINEARINVSREVIKKIDALGEKIYQSNLKWYHKAINFFFPSWKKRIKIRKLEDLINVLVSTANKIGKRGRFGKANFAIVNSGMAALIQDLSKFVSTKPKTNNQLTSVYELGNFDGIKVFVDQQKKFGDNEMILGYKGTKANPGVVVGFYAAEFEEQNPQLSTNVGPKIGGDPNKRYLRTRHNVVETGTDPSVNYEKVYLKLTN